MNRDKKVQEIFNEDVEYFSYGKDESNGRTKFMVVKLNDSQQWIKIMLNKDFTWMSFKINNGLFSLLALADSEPKYTHCRKAHLFGMDQDSGMNTLTSTMKKVYTVLNNKSYKDKEDYPIPYEKRALKSFNLLFEGKL